MMGGGNHNRGIAVLVLFTGMPRSGSTWAYNVARVLLLARQQTVFGEYRDDIASATAANPAADHHLIKCHTPDEAGRAHIAGQTCKTICTYRNPLECIASHIEVFGAPFEEALAEIRDGVALLRFQAALPGVLFVGYEAIVAQPSAVVAAIAGYLDCPLATGDAARIVAHFSKENVARFTRRFKDHADAKVGAAEAWESVTLFYSDHIRAHPGAPETVLTPEQLRTARLALAGTIDEAGDLAGDLVRALTAAAPGLPTPGRA
jgi:hypothetical protein